MIPRMTPTRYSQFCALARAAELVGERWTLLIIRELLLGPKRFSDLRAGLDGISSSVLSDRLARLEEAGVVRRAALEPPAASTVYELTDDGRALQPAIFELIRWGGRFLLPPRPGERMEPDWMRLALAACARKGPTPERSFEVHVSEGEKSAVIHVAGGPDGTSVDEGPAEADVTIRGDGLAVLGLMAGLVDPQEAVHSGRIEAEGDLAALPVFSDLFAVSADQEVSM